MTAVACVAVLALWAGSRFLAVPVRTTGGPAPTRPRRPRRPRRPTGDAGDALIALLDTIAAELRSGASPAMARRRAQALHPDAPRLELGADDADVAVARQALSAASLGGAAAAAIDAAAATLRDRRRVRLERRAQASQARLSAVVLTAVPPVFAVWAAATSASTRRAYTATTLGAGALVGGIALNLIGWWWMSRVIAGDRAHRRRRRPKDER
jgi:tight adherence protein B